MNFAVCNAFKIHPKWQVENQMNGMAYIEIEWQNTTKPRLRASSVVRSWNHIRVPKTRQLNSFLFYCFVHSRNINYCNIKSFSTFYWALNSIDPRCVYHVILEEKKTMKKCQYPRIFWLWCQKCKNIEKTTWQSLSARFQH